MSAQLYVLLDPAPVAGTDQLEVRAVGATKNALNLRLNQYRSNARAQAKRARGADPIHAWVKGLLDAGTEPVIVPAVTGGFRVDQVTGRVMVRPDAEPFLPALDEDEDDVLSYYDAYNASAGHQPLLNSRGGGGGSLVQHRLSPAERALFGVVSDLEVCRRYRARTGETISPNTVGARRRALGIKPSAPKGNGLKLTDEETSLLGVLSDRELAERISARVGYRYVPNLVGERRRVRGIPPAKRTAAAAPKAATA